MTSERLGSYLAGMTPLEQQLAEHEGFRSKPYLDSLGNLTIGYGRNLAAVGISQSEALLLLDNDIAATNRFLDTYWSEWRSLAPIRQRVVQDMAFTLRSRFLQFRDFLGAMAAKDYSGAADAMLDSLWAKQVGSRATRLAEMMRTGQDVPFGA